MKHILTFSTLFLLLCSTVLLPDAVYLSAQQPFNPIVLDGIKIGDNNGTQRPADFSIPISFSAEHKTSRYHTTNPQYSLDRMSTKKLLWFFTINNYTQEQILSCPLLYMPPAYLAIAKQLPKYSRYVKMYHDEYKKFNWFTKGLGRMLFIYTPKLQKQFALLWQECELIAQQEQEVQIQKQQKVDAYCAKIDAIRRDDEAVPTVPFHHQQARDTAYTQIKTTALDTVTRNYTVESDTITFAREYNITRTDLITLRGNVYEHQLHSEFLEQLHEIHTISTYYTLQSKNLLIDAVGNSIAIGMEANRLQQPETATIWANFGWKTLEAIEAFGDGLVLFAENTFGTVNMVLHPFHTLQHVIQRLGMITGLIARTCARSASTALYWHELMEQGDALLMAQEMDQVAYKVSAFGHYCIEKIAALEAKDVIKHGTAIAADVLLTHKMLMLGSTLCTRAHPIIRNIMADLYNRFAGFTRVIKHTVEAARIEAPVLQTAEGLLVKASENINKVGGGVSTIVRNTRTILEVVHAEYMAALELELGTLRIACDNKIKDIVRFGNKYLKPEYEHILGMDLYFSRRGVPKIGVFHHDLMQTVEKTDVFKFVDKVVHDNKCYSAKVYYGEHLVKDGTFFPAHWSREQVIEKIYEAYNNLVKSGVKFELENGKYYIQSTTNEGIKIEMYITTNGHIKTTYPIF